MWPRVLMIREHLQSLGILSELNLSLVLTAKVLQRETIILLFIIYDIYIRCVFSCFALSCTLLYSIEWIKRVSMLTYECFICGKTPVGVSYGVFIDFSSYTGASITYELGGTSQLAWKSLLAWWSQRGSIQRCILMRILYR